MGTNEGIQMANPSGETGYDDDISFNIWDDTERFLINNTAIIYLSTQTSIYPLQAPYTSKTLMTEPYLHGMK
jgi:hypothetical protein